MTADVRHREMTLMLPRFYDDAPEAEAIMRASAEQVEDTRFKARDLMAQFSAVTATWGLSDWERVLELPPRPNSSEEVRRARILAKLRGTQPATLANMLAILNAHTVGRNNEIVEIPSPGVVKFLVDASENFSYGPLIDDIRTYIPAHLAIQFGSKTASGLRLGTISMHGADITVYPYRKEFVPIETSVTHGGVSTHAHTVSIYPKGAE